MPYIIGVVTVVILGVGFTLYQSNVQTKAEQAKQESSFPLPAENAPLTQRELDIQKGVDVPDLEVAPDPEETGYRDGEYTTNTTYINPIRASYKLEVILTLEKEQVIAAHINYSQGAETDPNAQRFEKAFRSEVVGQYVDDINLSRVGGASLTTNAFNNALKDIKEQAS